MMMNESNVIDLLHSGHKVLWALALSWLDAKEGRSVKQNAEQRMQQIEQAMQQYAALVGYQIRR